MLQRTPRGGEAPASDNTASRRGFLKLAGVGVGAALLGAIGFKVASGSGSGGVAHTPNQQSGAQEGNGMELSPVFPQIVDDPQRRQVASELLGVDVGTALRHDIDDTDRWEVAFFDGPTEIKSKKYLSVGVSARDTDGDSLAMRERVYGTPALRDRYLLLWDNGAGPGDRARIAAYLERPTGNVMVFGENTVTTIALSGIVVGGTAAAGYAPKPMPWNGEPAQAPVVALAQLFRE